MKKNQIIPFIKEEVYSRSEIHKKYGGNPQAGISNSASNPFIFLFSGKSGLKHGYIDKWQDENIYTYTGQGTIGDMHFENVNGTLLNHENKSKRIFLFEKHGKHIKFIDEMKVLNFEYYIGQDTNQKSRIAILFYLTRVSSTLNPGVLQYFREAKAKNVASRKITEGRNYQKTRIGQNVFRNNLLIAWDFKCAITNISKVEILRSSHIKPWKDSNNEERLDTENGIILSPLFDALFDKYFISFENDGTIILSNKMNLKEFNLIGVSGKEKINRNLSVRTREYLKIHRETMAKGDHKSN